MRLHSFSVSSSSPEPAARSGFGAFVGERDYPCVMAKSVFRRDTATVRTYTSMSDTEALGDDLRAFVAEPDPERGYRSFVAVFGGPESETEAAYETALWTLLRALHASDGEAWDPDVSADPSDPTFSFSFAGRAFYVVGMHPQASRPARRFAHPAVVFNLHTQFEQLRREGRYDKVRSLIRERDAAFAGSVNPMMEDFGVRSEARQYAGRAVADGWQCPFAARASAGTEAASTEAPRTEAPDGA